MKGRKIHELCSEVMASSGHSISHVKHMRQSRPQMGYPALFSLMFLTGQSVEHRPHRLHFLTSTFSDLLYSQVVNQRLYVNRSMRWIGDGALSLGALRYCPL